MRPAGDPIFSFPLSLARRPTFSTAALNQTSLLQEFLNSSATPLTAPEQAYLDARGNGNGRHDVGDLRAYLRR